jgi:hypothetical protein
MNDEWKGFERERLQLNRGAVSKPVWRYREKTREITASVIGVLAHTRTEQPTEHYPYPLWAPRVTGAPGCAAALSCSLLSAFLAVGVTAWVTLNAISGNSVGIGASIAVKYVNVLRDIRTWTWSLWVFRPSLQISAYSTCLSDNIADASVTQSDAHSCLLEAGFTSSHFSWSSTIPHVLSAPLLLALIVQYTFTCKGPNWKVQTCSGHEFLIQKQEKTPVS